MAHRLQCIFIKLIPKIFSSICKEEELVEENQYQMLLKIVINAASLFMEAQPIGRRLRLGREYFQLILQEISLPIGLKPFCFTVTVLSIKDTQRIQFPIKTLNCISEEVLTLGRTLPISINATISAAPIKLSSRVHQQAE